jgi:hypothetical protein
LEKKEPKKLIRLAAAWVRGVHTPQVMESFFASFCSQKEDLP